MLEDMSTGFWWSCSEETGTYPWMQRHGILKCNVIRGMCFVFDNKKIVKSSKVDIKFGYLRIVTHLTTIKGKYYASGNSIKKKF